MKRIVLVLGVIAIAALSATAQERFLKPVDEAKLDPGFLAFRTKLIAAAERKDAKHVLSVVDPAIRNGFGDRNGISWFKSDWKLNNKNSEFWSKFLAVIRNGGSFQGEGTKKMNSFTAPYTFSNWPEDLDSFEYFAIFGSDVNARKTPLKDGEVVAKLSYNLVKIDSDLGNDGKVPEYRKVTTLGGIAGYIHRDYVRSSIDYRAGFEKKRGVWKMTFFLAGD